MPCTLHTIAKRQDIPSEQWIFPTWSVLILARKRSMLTSIARDVLYVNRAKTVDQENLLSVSTLKFQTGNRALFQWKSWTIYLRPVILTPLRSLLIESQRSLTYSHHILWAHPRKLLSASLTETSHYSAYCTLFSHTATPSSHQNFMNNSLSLLASRLRCQHPNTCRQIWVQR